MPQIGIIAIGRNEGERLRRCLASAVGRGWPVVYVDSASTDGSPAMARDMGAEVVYLDMSVPFSAARARNEGMSRLLAIAPGVTYVQMVDGDCEIVEGWITRAKQELDANPKAAVVCGRRRERYPEASIYNRIADIEWNTPIGEARSCGGDAMFRVAAFQEVGGYDNSVVAGEEPELCQRLREAGWKVLRIDGEMTIHDSAMTRFAQWWKRSVRSGYGAMDVATRFRRGKDGLFVKQVKSARVWAGYLPGLVLLLSICTIAIGVAWLAVVWTGIVETNHERASARLSQGLVLQYVSLGMLGLTLCVALGYLAALLLQAIRIGRGVRHRTSEGKPSIAYGCLTVLGKFANMKGQRQYLRDRKAGKLTRMIDYKSAGAAPTDVGRALPAGKS